MTDEASKKILARAEKAVQEASVEFNSDLYKRVLAIEVAMKNDIQEDAVKLIYNLESEASTFGLPRVSRICKWLRQVLTKEYDQEPTNEEILVIVNSLKLMTKAPEEDGSGRDEELFSQLYPILQKAISDI